MSLELVVTSSHALKAISQNNHSHVVVVDHDALGDLV
jgi:hypothetical protein